MTSTGSRLNIIIGVLHPNMADVYREKVTQLVRGLEQEESRTAAADALRGLIDAIVLSPQKGALRIELPDNLAAMLKAAHAQSTAASMAPLGRWEDKRSPDDGDLVQILLDCRLTEIHRPTIQGTYGKSAFWTSPTSDNSSRSAHDLPGFRGLLLGPQ